MAVNARLPAALQPLLGALLGLCGCGLIIVLPHGPGAVAALALWTGVSMAAGERGFARWFPSLPLLGALLAACSLLLRWYSLTSLESSPARLMAGVIAAMTLGPAASVGLVWISRPVDQTAFRRSAMLATPGALIAFGEGALACLACGPRVGSILVLAAYLLLRLVAMIVTWRFTGVRGSDPDACRMLVETAALLLVSSLRDI